MNEVLREIAQMGASTHTANDCAQDGPLLLPFVGVRYEECLKTTEVLKLSSFQFDSHDTDGADEF